MMDFPGSPDVVDYLLGDVLGLNEQAKPAPRPASVQTTRTDEPIAIVSVSCRFPARLAEAFWEVLSGGVDTIREVRMTASRSMTSTTRIRCPIYTASGGFVDESMDSIRVRDPPRGRWIDPQQRLMLETAEGLEEPGTRQGALRGSRTGIFVGVAANEYAHLLSAESFDKSTSLHHGQRAQCHLRSGRVRASDSKAGGGGRYRVRSSALVAVHQACQALRPVTAIWRWPVA